MKAVTVTGQEIIFSGPGEPLERTVVLTGLREWGEVTVRATASGTDPVAIAGWKALTRLWCAEPGTTKEEWVAFLERPEGGPPFWNWLQTGLHLESQPATITLEQFAKIAEANRGEPVTSQDAAKLLIDGLLPDS